MEDQVMAYIRSDPSGLFQEYNGNMGGTVDADASADTALEAQGGSHCYVDGGGTGGHDSPLALMQRTGGPSMLFTSPPPLGHADVRNADTALEAQVGGHGTGGQRLSGQGISAYAAWGWAAYPWH
jgi:hypothetical protein